MTIEDRVIKAFGQQVEKLDTIHTTPDGRLWINFTYSFIKKYIGNDTDLLRYPGTNNRMFFQDSWSIDSDKKLGKNLLENCIQYIQINGVPDHLKPAPPAPAAVIKAESPKVNFLYRIPEGWAIALVTTVSVILYGAGDYMAKNKIDEERINLKTQVKQLEAQNSQILLRLKRVNDSTRSALPLFIKSK